MSRTEKLVWIFGSMTAAGLLIALLTPFLESGWQQTAMYASVTVFLILFFLHILLPWRIRIERRKEELNTGVKHEANMANKGKENEQEKRLIISFDQVKTAVNDLIATITEEEFNPDYLIVPAGGGCIVAGLLQTEMERNNKRYNCSAC
ncbi:hypothetical protein KA005_33010 [bacterium]|nr:hypothetical protein [bacterium]